MARAQVCIEGTADGGPLRSFGKGDSITSSTRIRFFTHNRAISALAGFFSNEPVATGITVLAGTHALRERLAERAPITLSGAHSRSSFQTVPSMR